MILPTGDYRYVIRRSGEPLATEQMKVLPDAISGVWKGSDGRSLEVEAKLGSEGAVQHLTARYSSTLFKRTATYEAAEDNFRGRVSAVAGRNEIVGKLGRFREV